MLWRLLVMMVFSNWYVGMMVVEKDSRVYKPDMCITVVFMPLASEWDRPSETSSDTVNKNERLSRQVQNLREEEDLTKKALTGLAITNCRMQRTPLARVTAENSIYDRKELAVA